MKKLNTWPAFSVEESNKVSKVLLSNKVNYWTGEECRNFEIEYAALCNTQYAIALANGTLALELALKAIDVKHNDEVIVSPRSFVASASCVKVAGAEPIFAEVDSNIGNISADTIRSQISEKTKAVICVHITGHPCEMDEILDLCRKNNIWLIEDCSQAHGAKYKNQPVGSIGDIGCFSFCQDKIITTGGEGGMVVTNNKNLWEKMWSYKDHGKSFSKMFEEKQNYGFKWVHDSIGSNYRMTEIQAAIGRLQINKLDEWNHLRQKNAERIINSLAKFPEVYRIPEVKSYMQHAWYKLNIFLKDSALVSIKPVDLINLFTEAGVPCFAGPCPEIYLEKSFENNKAYSCRLPNARKLGETSIMFLVHPSFSDEDLKFICSTIEKISEDIKVV